MFLPKALLAMFLSTTASQDLVHVDYSASTVESQPDVCEMHERYENLQLERPLTNEEDESLDFFARACGVQRGAESLTGIVDDFGNAVDKLQQPTIALDQYTAMMRRVHDPNAYMCC